MKFLSLNAQKLLLPLGALSMLLLLSCGGSPTASPDNSSSSIRAPDSHAEPESAPAATPPRVAEGQPKEPTAPADEISEDDSATPSLEVAAAGPLSDAQRAVFWGSLDDEVPEVLNAVKRENYDTHFLSSDELHQDLFADKIANLGGGYIGVGTDQCWLFMGWQKPSLAWLADYDRWVVALHWAYIAFFDRSTSIDEFISYWAKDNAKDAIAVLSAEYADRQDRKLIIQVYREARHKVARRLRRIVTMGKRKRPNFLTDLAQFTYLKTMIEEGRVRPLVGNMLAENGYAGMGESANKLGVVIRHLYLSNAEDYWPYRDVFRSNMRGLPADAQSVVSRARASKPTNKDYRYMQQPLQLFTRWLDTGVDRCRDMWRSRPVAEDEFPYTWFTKEPK